jgi:hypothetical protein
MLISYPGEKRKKGQKKTNNKQQQHKDARLKKGAAALPLWQSQANPMQ